MSARKHPLKQEDPVSGDGYASKLLVPTLCQGEGEQGNDDHWEEKVTHLIQDEPLENAYFEEPYAESDYLIPSSHSGVSTRHFPSQACTSGHVDSPGCASFSHTQSGLPPFRDAVLNAFKREAVSLSELGQTVAEYGTTPEREQLVTKMLKEARLDVHLVKKLQHRARDLSQSSDPIVGELSTIVQQLADGYVGISVALDLCLSWCRDLQQANMKTNAEVARATSSRRLPDNIYLSACNLTKEWTVPLTGPFKAINLNNLLRSWAPSTRIPRENHFTHCVDLIRFYLTQATDPPEAVQTYACRLSGKSGKCTHLIDFPETIIRTLTDFSSTLSDYATKIWMLALKNSLESAHGIGLGSE